MSVIISTNDCCIDTRMGVIWSALNSDTEILESVSLPEKLSSYKNHELESQWTVGIATQPTHASLLPNIMAMKQDGTVGALTVSLVTKP